MTNEALEDGLRAAFRLMRSEATADEANEFIFHLGDCAEDLERYVAVLKSPSSYTEAEMKDVLDCVLLHAAGHIVQAARLYGGFIDTFGRAPEAEHSKG